MKEKESLKEQATEQGIKRVRSYIEGPGVGRERWGGLEITSK
jgi:hypothetical protein